MDVTRQKLLALVGALNFAEEPSGDSGGDGTDKESTGDSDKETTGGGDRESGDDEGADDEGDGDFKPITSKDEFNRILGKRLHRERAKFSDYDDLKQTVAAQESTIADLQEKLGESALKDQRKSIAEAAGVPENLLRGANPDELKAHAEELKAAFTKTDEDDRIAKRRAARSPHTGTGEERPPSPSQEKGREEARAYLDKNKRKDQVS